MCAGSGDPETAALVAIDEYVTQVIVQAELQKTVTGACNCPSILFVMIYDQTMSHNAVPESAVVVSTATGAVLDAQNIIMVVHHLMQQCGTNLFDGTGQGTGTKINLMKSAFLGNPCIFPKGEMPIGLRS